jgi:PAS domain S-box-containing protein
MIRNLSIHNRLTLVLLGAAVLALLTGGVGLVLFQNYTLEFRTRQIMEPYAQLVSAGTEAAIAFEDPQRAQEILDTLRANPQILEADIYLESGRLLSSFSRTPNTQSSHLQTTLNGLYFGNGNAEMLRALPHGARLYLKMGLDQLNEQTRQTLWFFGVAALVFLIATLGQLAVLRRTIVRPIASLTRAAEIARTHADYRHRVPSEGADEVARLGQSFNDMMAAIQQREDDLQRLTIFQRTILDNAAYGIITTTPDGIVTSFNPAAERLLGYKADEIVNEKMPLFWHDPLELARHAAQLSEQLGETVAPGFDVFTAHPRHNLPEECEWTFIRKDGQRIPVSLSVTALRDSDNRITGFVGLTYDLTERKQAEEEIRRLNQKLEQRVAERTAELQVANKELEAFSYSVSHDLRAPLRHIDGFLDLLRNRASESLDDKSRHYMDTISNAAKRMGVLIDDLLSFSRMGRNEMAAARVDMNMLLKEVIPELPPVDASRIINWHIDELPVVTGDRAMLRVVLVNLLSNALKFTKNCATTKIDIGCQSDPSGESVFFVRDNGAGFDMQYAAKLFGVFQRLHGSDEFEGTGIGLANVRRIINRHGGKTWAEGKVNGGATFYFSLPNS